MSTAAGSTHAPRQAPEPSGGVALFEQRQFSRSLGASVVPALAWAKLGELDALLERVNTLYEEAVAEIARASSARPRAASPNWPARSSTASPPASTRAAWCHRW